jgi:GT2 family glycosyltransferase
MSGLEGEPGLPPVTVVIATRNRGDSVVTAIKSILCNDYPSFELLIVDQSENDLTEKAVRPYLTDPRFGYLKTATHGLGISHNLAVSRATTEIIAITDDDCEVAPDWICQMVRAFGQNPRLGMVFGNVVPNPRYDASTGYIPHFMRHDSYLLTGLNCELIQGLGIGACMGVRRSAWEKVQGFDEMLGPGAPLGSLEDRDIAIRMLAAGFSVVHAPSVSVIHSGFRYNRELRKMAFRDWLGFGSSYAKYLKCGYWEVTHYMLIQMWWGQAVRRSLRRLRHERRLRNVTPVVSFWLGFLAGLFTRVNRTTGHFRPRRPGRMPNHYRLAWLLKIRL